MIYSNGRIMIHGEGNLDALEYAVASVIEFLSPQYPGLTFEFKTEPYAHYLVPEPLTYQNLKNVLGDQLKRKAINEDTLEFDTRVNKSYEHYFTEAEHEEIADNMAETIKKIEDIENEKKNFDNQMNAQLKELEKELKRYSRNRLQGYERKEVTCIKQLNFEEGKVYYLAEETGMVIGVEEMTSGERQMKITFDQTPYVDPVEAEYTPVSGEEAAGLAMTGEEGGEGE